MTKKEKEDIIAKIAELYEKLGWRVLLFSDNEMNVPAILGGTEEFVEGVKDNFYQAEQIASSMDTSLEELMSDEELIDAVENVEELDDPNKKKTFH